MIYCHICYNQRVIARRLFVREGVVRDNIIMLSSSVNWKKVENGEWGEMVSFREGKADI